MYRLIDGTPAVVTLLLDLAARNLASVKEEIHTLVKGHFDNNHKAKQFVDGLCLKGITEDVSGPKLYAYKEGNGKGCLSAQFHVDMGQAVNRFPTKQGHLGTWVVR